MKLETKNSFDELSKSKAFTKLIKTSLKGLLKLKEGSDTLDTGDIKEDKAEDASFVETTMKMGLETCGGGQSLLVTTICKFFTPHIAYTQKKWNIERSTIVYFMYKV